MMHRKPFPDADCAISPQYIIDSLPPLDAALQQLGFMHVLTTEKIIYSDTYLSTITDEGENSSSTDEYLQKMYRFTSRAGHSGLCEIQVTDPA